MLLDNARDAEQVRPLLPAAPHCRVLITSRSRLSGLAVREGMQRISLETLALRDAIRLLRRTIGERAVAEPGATAALAELCARHPLALRIAAERIAGDETMTVTDAVAALSVAANRLSELSVEDDETAAIRTVFGWSYQTLPSPARRMFRLLGLHDGPDLPLAACGALSDLSEEACTEALARLTDSNLAEEYTPGRFRLHDLLRLFAHERALVEDSEQDRTAAVTGLTDWFLHSACTARVTLDPHLPPLEPPVARLAMPAQRFADDQAALAWCELERQNLTAIALQAQQFNLNEQGWKLPTALFPFFDRRKHFGDWIATHKAAALCAHQLGDREAEGKVLCNLGSAYRPMRRFDEAVDNYERAIVLMREVGWRTGEAKVLGNLAATARRRRPARGCDNGRPPVVHPVQGARRCVGAGAVPVEPREFVCAARPVRRGAALAADRARPLPRTEGPARHVACGQRDRHGDGQARQAAGGAGIRRRVSARFRGDRRRA